MTPEHSTLQTLSQQWFKKSLTEQQSTLLKALIEHSADAALGSITQLAREQGVSPSALTRLAQKLGYRGFPAFQAAFKRQLTPVDSPYHQRLRSSLELPADNAAQQVIWQTAEDELRNIKTLTHQLDPAQFDRVANALAQANKVRLHGLRQQHAISTFLCYGLSMIRPDVALLGSENLGFGPPLADLGDQDILIVFGCAPHTHITLEVAKEARQRNLRVVAFTDALDSPLALAATETFILSTQGRYYINNLASWMVFAEALMTRTAQLLGDQAQQQLSERVTLHQQLGTQSSKDR